MPRRVHCCARYAFGDGSHDLSCPTMALSPVERRTWIDRSKERKAAAERLANLGCCLRDAGALAHAWNLGTQNGALWATGRAVLRRFGPEAK